MMSAVVSTSHLKPRLLLLQTKGGASLKKHDDLLNNCSNPARLFVCFHTARSVAGVDVRGAEHRVRVKEKLERR